jgi:Flp pilus assembly protein TadG
VSTATPTGRRAGAAVEFALTLPVLIILLAGVVDYGWYYFVQGAVHNAAKDAVRMGVVAQAGENPADLAEQVMNDVLDDAGLSCSGTCTVTGAITVQSGYRLLEVTVERPFDPIVGLVPTPTNNAIAYTMLLESQDTGFYLP